MKSTKRTRKWRVRPWQKDGVPEADERIILIEYQQGKPFAVLVSPVGHEDWVREYDCEWCARDQMVLFNQSGSGYRPSLGPLCDRRAGLPVWIEPGVRVFASDPEDPTPLTAKAIRALGYKQIESPLRVRGHASPFNDWISMGDCPAEYCRICGDNYPDSDLCEHLSWCPLCEEIVLVDGHADTGTGEKRSTCPNAGKPVEEWVRRIPRLPHRDRAEAGKGEPRCLVSSPPPTWTDWPLPPKSSTP